MELKTGDMVLVKMNSGYYKAEIYQIQSEKSVGQFCEVILINHPTLKNVRVKTSQITKKYEDGQR